MARYIHDKVHHELKSVAGYENMTAVQADITALKSSAGKRLTAQTLAVGATSLTFTDTSITANSTVRVFADKFGVAPTNVTSTTGSATVTFNAQDTAMSVYIIVS